MVAFTSCLRITAALVAVAAVGVGVALYDGPYIQGEVAAGLVPGATMKAALHVGFGDDMRENVKVSTGVPLPEVGRHDVLIKVYAAAVNPVDYKIVKEHLRLITGPPFALRPALPSTLGFDVAGTVAAVGSAVTRLSPGEKVYAMSSFRFTGAFAEYTAVAEKLVSVMPDGLSFEEAAAIPLAGLTSLQALRDKGGLKEGDRVLVLGGSSGTGVFGIQIAKALGASHVATTASPRNAELVADLGVDEVINYREVDFADVLGPERTYDVVYDCIGGIGQWEGAKKILKPGGTFVTIVGDKPMGALTIPKLASRGISMVRRSMESDVRYRAFQTTTSRADLDILSDMVTAGTLKAVVDSTFSLDDTVGALQRSQSGQASGKIVITVP